MEIAIGLASSAKDMSDLRREVKWGL